MEIKLGGMEQAAQPVSRLTNLIWGPSGFGKTTLAATGPGKRKALINFDPDGPSSLPDPEALGISIFDLSGSADRIAAKFKDTDVFGLEKVMDRYDGFIVDSLTTIMERTLGYGIEITKGATVERPSPGAYMARNNLVITLVRDLLQVTAKHNKHLTFIAHEGPPDKSEEGNILGITMSLGGQLPQQTALRINECWCMHENSKNEKYILVRKARMREPCKSRMFDSTQTPEFKWVFDPNNWNDPKNMHASTWWELWQAHGFKKLPQPGSAQFDALRKQYNV